MQAVDGDRLLQALESVPSSAWSLPSTLEATGAHHGYRQVSLVDSCRFRPESQRWRFVLDEFRPVRSAWLSWIEPGGFILPHTDAGPHHERWQVPIVAAGLLSGVAPVLGVPFNVEHWRPHSVRNDTDHPRIHLVIDRDVIVRAEPTPFKLTQGATDG